LKDEAVRLVIGSGRPIAPIARELKISDQRWHARQLGGPLSRSPSGFGDAVVGVGADAVCAVGAGASSAPGGQRVPGKSRCLLRAGSSVNARYAFIGEEKASSGFPVCRGCRLLGVSTSGYYGWRDRPASATTIRRALVAADAAREHAASDGIFGYRRVHVELLATGAVVSVQLVRRVLREQALAGATTRAYRVTTRQDADATAAPDLVRRDFSSATPGAKLVGDITYIRTWRGWAYLAVVIDCATRRVVGWSLAERASAKLCTDALAMAARNGQLSLSAIFHTDRGCQPRFKGSSQHCPCWTERIGRRVGVRGE